MLINRLTALIVCLCLLSSTPAALCQTTGENPINWIEDLAEARAAALSENRLILLDFYSENCSWCKRLDQRLRTDPKFSKLAELVVFARFDGKEDKDIAKGYGVNMLPTLILAKPDGSEIDRIAGVKANQPVIETLLNYTENHGTLDAFLRQFSRSPKDVKLCMRIAQKYYYRSEYDSAISYYETVLDVDSLNSDGAADNALFEIGKCYMKLSEYEKSIEAFKQMESRFPNSNLNEDAYLYIPFVLDKAGKTIEAIEQYKVFQSKFPHSDQIDWVSGEIEKLERRKN